MLQLTSLTSRIIAQKLIYQQIFRYTTNSTVIFKNPPEKIEVVDVGTKLPIENVSPKNPLPEDKSSKLVAAAFASLKAEVVPEAKKIGTKSKGQVRRVNPVDEAIEKATTVNELLKVAENTIVSRRHALKVVSVLAEWSTSNQCKLSEFDTDPRFTKLCRILGRNNNKANPQPVVSTLGDDLSMVLGVTGDDEAAKLIESISLPQMVKVLSTLAQKRRRSTPLLRSLTNNITKSTDKLDLKQSADVLYAAAVLTFPEIPLLEKACTDVVSKLPENTDKSAVVGSILTSIGILRYRNTEILDAISEWIVKYNEISRPQDIFALFITLAMVNYHPVNSERLYTTLIPQLNIEDATKSTAWVDLIWSLVVLNLAKPNHIESVLKPEFISRLKDENNLSIATKIKLLQIQAAAKTLIPDYKQSLIEDADITTVTVTRSKEKQSLVAAMLDSLGNLLPSMTYLRSNIDTGMGFILDGECLMDDKCNPVALDNQDQTTNAIKIAFIAYDYHDLCRGCRFEITGVNDLVRRLLEAKGYQLVTVPYTDFNPRDKLIKRVQYLEKHLKDIVKKNVK